MIRSLRRCAALIAPLALLAGCSKSGLPTEAPEGPAAEQASKPRQVFRYGNGSEPQDLDPQQVQGTPELHLIEALFEGLLAEDPKTCDPMPGLAKSWEISPDGLVYTFHLRENIKWSDGVPITANDFLLSWKRMISPNFASQYAYLVYNFVKNAKDYYDGKITDFSLVGFKAPDDRTLVVTLSGPTPFLLKIIANHYAWHAVPIHTILKYGALDQRSTAWTRAGNMVSNGPFMLKEWSPQQRIVVVRNPNYWDAATVKLDEVDFFPTDDIPAEERMFRSGQIDVTTEVPNSKRDPYRKEHPDELHIEPFLGVYYYRCNVTVPPLNDKRVRKALALAIDREALIRDVVRGGEQPAYAVSYPGTAGYFPRARITGTLDDARRLLAEAGYPGGKGMPTIQFIYNTNDNHKQVGEAIQEMWRKELGVNIELQNQEWKVYLDNQHTQNYQLQRAGWIADYVDPHVFLEIWETGNGNNDTLWSNADYDRLLHEALQARDDKERYEIYQKMDAILVDECPVIPIYYYTRVYLLNPKVRGYWPTLLDTHPFKYIYFEK
jgi:oligopeptide transport system substrate-binding protein